MLQGRGEETRFLVITKTINANLPIMDHSINALNGLTNELNGSINALNGSINAKMYQSKRMGQSFNQMDCNGINTR